MLQDGEEQAEMAEEGAGGVCVCTRASVLQAFMCALSPQVWENMFNFPFNKTAHCLHFRHVDNTLCSFILSSQQPYEMPQSGEVTGSRSHSC